MLRQDFALVVRKFGGFVNPLGGLRGAAQLLQAELEKSSDENRYTMAIVDLIAASGSLLPDLGIHINIPVIAVTRCGGKFGCGFVSRGSFT